MNQVTAPGVVGQMYTGGMGLFCGNQTNVQEFGLSNSNNPRQVGGGRYKHRSVQARADRALEQWEDELTSEF